MSDMKVLNNHDTFQNYSIYYKKFQVRGMNKFNLPSSIYQARRKSTAGRLDPWLKVYTSLPMLLNNLHYANSG